MVFKIHQAERARKLITYLLIYFFARGNLHKKLIVRFLHQAKIYKREFDIFSTRYTSQRAIDTSLDSK